MLKGRGKKRQKVSLCLKRVRRICKEIPFIAIISFSQRLQHKFSSFLLTFLCAIKFSFSRSNTQNVKAGIYWKSLFASHSVSHFTWECTQIREIWHGMCNFWGWKKIDKNLWKPYKCKLNFENHTNVNILLVSKKNRYEINEYSQVQLAHSNIHNLFIPTDNIFLQL